MIEKCTDPCICSETFVYTPGDFEAELVKTLIEKHGNITSTMLEDWD